MSVVHRSYLEEEKILQSLSRVSLGEPSGVGDDQSSIVESVHTITVLHH